MPAPIDLHYHEAINDSSAVLAKFMEIKESTTRVNPLFDIVFENLPDIFENASCKCSSSSCSSSLSDSEESIYESVTPRTEKRFKKEIAKELRRANKISHEDWPSCFEIDVSQLPVQPICSNEKIERLSDYLKNQEMNNVCQVSPKFTPSPRYTPSSRFSRINVDSKNRNLIRTE